MWFSWLETGRKDRASRNSAIRKARPHKGRGNVGQAKSLSYYLADVVLLPVQGRVRLDDDVFVRGLLEFVYQHGFASLERFGNFRMHAQGQICRFVIGSGDGHLARFGLNFVAERG